jgi:hypothetical protein
MESHLPSGGETRTRGGGRGCRATPLDRERGESPQAQVCLLALWCSRRGWYSRCAMDGKHYIGHCIQVHDVDLAPPSRGSVQCREDPQDRICQELCQSMIAGRVWDCWHLRNGLHSPARPCYDRNLDLGRCWFIAVSCFSKKGARPGSTDFDHFHEQLQ